MTASAQSIISLSVMIPTWRPNTAYLESAVGSVLEQVGTDEDVQVEIVDDCSPDFDPYAFASRYGAGVLSAHRHDRRLGLAGNWNACLERAGGRWIHILHQDDFVLDGFYEKLFRGVDDRPDVGAAFCESWFMDADGNRRVPRLVPMDHAGILDNWLQHVFVRLSIQCSALVVRRDVYDSIGDFDAGYDYALDWDMCKRIAARYPIWYEPEPLACYRMHAAAETGRLRRTGRHLVEVFRSIDHSAQLLSPQTASWMQRQARRHYAVFAVEQAVDVIRSSREWMLALRFLRVAWRETSLPIMTLALLKVLVRGVVRRAGALLRRLKA